MRPADPPASYAKKKKTKNRWVYQARAGGKGGVSHDEKKSSKGTKERSRRIQSRGEKTKITRKPGLGKGSKSPTGKSLEGEKGKISKKITQRAKVGGDLRTEDRVEKVWRVGLGTRQG